MKVQIATGIFMSLHARMLIGLYKLRDEAPDQESWKDSRLWNVKGDKHVNAVYMASKLPL